MEMVTGWVHWIVNVSNCKRTCGLQEETSTSPNRRERPQIRKIGWGTTERDRDRWTERERKRECLMKKEDKSLIYVENVAG